jgi:exodeoxyribonuclease VII small subunit
LTEPAVDVIKRLEAAIERLSDGSAPLEELIAAHQEALKLLAEAEADLARLRERASVLAESLEA